MIEIKNLTVNYIEEFASVYNLSIEIKSNTLFVCDKLDGGFAILRTLAKIDKAYKGEILLDGVNLKHIKDKFLPIAFVPKKPYLFKSNIDKNLLFPLKIRKINKKTSQNAVNLLKNEYNLNNFPKKIKNLNFGEQKIICLARAIIRKPQYILVENFFENLEPEHIALAEKMIADASTFATIVATEKTTCSAYKNFNVIKLENGSTKQ